jgi:hypothetical protein
MTQFVIEKNNMCYLLVQNIDENWARQMVLFHEIIINQLLTLTIICTHLLLQYMSY